MQGRFQVDMRKVFFIMRILKHWNGLPREAGESLSLEIFKTQVDKAMSNLL